MSISKQFNKHLLEFIEDIILVFPRDYEIKAGKVAIIAIKNVNPSLLIRYWYEHIFIPYYDEIKKGNLDYFIEKDYSKDSELFDDPGYFMRAIDKFRGPIREMDQGNKNKAIKYVQNLCELSYIYKESKK